MTIVKEVVNALQQRLKELSIDATPDKLAYLAKALESIAGQSTVLDIVNITDEKLKELLDSATGHLNKLDTTKDKALTAISQLEKQSLKNIDDKSIESLSLLDTRKDANIAVIDSSGNLDQIKGAVDDLSKKIKSHSIIAPESVPLLFGILNRYNDNWGSSNFSSELGQWYSSTTSANYMLALLAGAHKESTKYCSFYKPPQLYFLQGTNGTFLYKEMYLRYAISTNIYQHPYALLGVIFVKNTSKEDITRTLNFTGSSGWSSGYEGAGVFVGTPDTINPNKEKTSTVTWANVQKHNSTSTELSSSATIVIPAEKTVAIVLYTSPYYYTNTNNYYAQFMYFGIYNFRSSFLTTRLEIDRERTLRALQCQGLEYVYQIWS
ncbi:MAG: hypothetical protein sL5_10600 [Candidatus Mesenet longicola]|uniref:Uncharacterized protein n=1 Tax=Candidatus Mesenet longicola TaxID=1892558 RepID=A0A8J3HVJ5_9RICK|nr:MAG: hypothetical protein sGL2_03110 [Candidatus Mesenet longicola]GHM60067.1 MAG: hypothetical protein sL5_10600 [Candidatus Mesenet longicola]